jgi:hypothetical protein
MQVVKRIIGGFFLFILFLWLFSPKQELYYLLEKELKKNDIIISNETVKDTWFGINLQNADVYVKGVRMAQIADLELNIFFLHNTLTINEIKTNEAVHNVAPKVINQALVKYSIMNPLNIELNGLGSFGTLEGNVNLIEKEITVLFPVAKDIKAFRKFLKKDETGEWKYETAY